MFQASDHSADPAGRIWRILYSTQADTQSGPAGGNHSITSYLRKTLGIILTLMLQAGLHDWGPPGTEHIPPLDSSLDGLHSPRPL